MSDLISRSETYKELINRIDWLREQDYRMYCCIGDCIQDTLAKQPTAYDVDKVVEELEKIRAKETCNKEKCDTKEICRICVVDDAIEIVEQEAERCNSGWIPCSERLPEEAFGCLVTVMDCEPSTQTDFENILPYFVGYDGETWNNADGKEIPFEVIAWMPLPKPYKESDRYVKH